MSGRPEEGLYGNVESQSSNVSQGGRRRTRSEFEGDTDYSSTTRIRLEGMYRPQWTMSSSVKDILLEGSTLRTDMKLNEFIRSNLGEEWVVERNGNVIMEAFVRRPNAYVQDQQLLEEILNLTAYQALKMELEERKILLEAIYKLHHEGVYFLRQWGEHEGKDTVSSHARGKLNGVLTGIEIEEKERRDAEGEKARREEKARRHAEEEKARREEQINFNLTLSIKDAIFQGRARVYKMKLNRFLKMELDGRGVADTNRSVLLKEFFKDPTRYVRDAGVLNEIQASDAYLGAERAVREEMDMEKDLRKLHYKHLRTLLGWSTATAEIRASVCDITKRFLDAALQEARNPTTTSAVMNLEGLYESVYNARWHHAVEVVGGERTQTGTGMEAKEGKPKKSWTYRAVGDTLEKDDAVQQSGAAPPVLMVLTSDRGWPYTLNGPHGCGNDLCVNCEVERVWQIVLDDLTKWLSNSDLTLNPSPLPRVLIGTPGIGKSMNAGSYLLYQLLHYDVEKLQVVIHCFGSAMYVFDKTTKTVTKYMGNKTSKSVLGGLWQRGMKGYIIYDVAKKGTPPDPDFAPSTGWGMIVVSSPNLDNYDEWKTQLKASRIIMNCPDEVDVKAMCAWMKRGLEQDKQAGYWEKVEKRMEKVGPIPRHIFDENEYGRRLAAVDDALSAIKDTDVEEYFSMGGEEKKWYSKNPCHKLVKIVRERKVEGTEVFLNASICTDIEFRIADRLAKKKGAKDLLLLILASRGTLASQLVEQLGLRAFMYGEFVIALLKELKELPPPSPSKPRSSVLNVNHQGYPTRAVGLKELQGGVTRIPMEYGVLYIPKVENFPLVDGFSLLIRRGRRWLGCR
ncbi:putative retrotransposon hot spot (RHS) protein, partial [Trypanosoma cruzi]